jgi:hypothetical protein
MCPLDYYYDPALFARAPDFTAEVLYVVGGLYGNLAAIDALETLVLAEYAPVTLYLTETFTGLMLIINGSTKLKLAFRRHCALRGNVENEICRTRDVGAGCGCAEGDLR